MSDAIKEAVRRARAERRELEKHDGPTFLERHTPDVRTVVPGQAVEYHAVASVKHETLDALVLSFDGAFARRASNEKTAECSVWDSSRGVWVESDAQLRARIKAGEHASINAESRVENLEHDSLFQRFEQLERLIDGAIKVCGGPGHGPRFDEMRTLVRLIRKQVLK